MIQAFLHVDRVRVFGSLLRPQGRFAVSGGHRLCTIPRRGDDVALRTPRGQESFDKRFTGRPIDSIRAGFRELALDGGRPMAGTGSRCRFPRFMGRCPGGGIASTFRLRLLASCPVHGWSPFRVARPIAFRLPAFAAGLRRRRRNGPVRRRVLVAGPASAERQRNAECPHQENAGRRPPRSDHPTNVDEGVRAIDWIAWRGALPALRYPE